MTDNVEESMPLTIFSNTGKQTSIEKYFNWNNNIETIHRIGRDGTVTLHIASGYKSNEVVQFLFTDNALKSIENLFDQSTLSKGSKIDEIKKLFQRDAVLFHSYDENQDSDYIEWSLSSEILIKKRQKFRELIDLYKTYDNQHHLISKLLIEIIDYYLNEYLIYREHFSLDETKKLESCFNQAIEEQNYLKYFIKAYTLTNSFHRVLNKHLALYILDYFDTTSYSSSPTKYRLINCLVHIVTLVINHPDIQKYKYKGTTYRGLLMTKNDIERYRIGNYILNRSFVSTSKNRSVAQLFAGNYQSNVDQTQVPVIFKYIIKQNQTAIDIERLSTIQDEQEVLIFPFSVFEVKDRIENDPKMSPPALFEFELEECEINEQINYRKQKGKLPANSQYQNKQRRKILRSRCIYGNVVLLIISSLILILLYVFKDKIFSKKVLNEKRIELQNNCPPTISRSDWNATDPKNKTPLKTPVPYVAILHTNGAQCKTLDSCISRIQEFQRRHMDTNKWDDIGYNFLIGVTGDIFQGRGWQYEGSHCKGFNPQSIGIGLIGDFISNQIPKILSDAVESLIDCGVLYGYIQKNYTVLGHWGHAVPESYLSSRNKSRHHMGYCLSKNQTVSLI